MVSSTEQKFLILASCNHERKPIRSNSLFFLFFPVTSFKAVTFSKDICKYNDSNIDPLLQILKYHNHSKKYV